MGALPQAMVTLSCTLIGSKTGLLVVGPGRILVRYI